MNKNTFLSLVSDFLNDTASREVLAFAALENNEVSEDERVTLRKAQQKLSTKLKYVSLLNNAEIATKTASFLKDDAHFRLCVNNSYAVEKLVYSAAAIVKKDKSILARDNTLIQAVTYLVATDFATITHEALSKNLFKKNSSSVVHDTPTQASQFCLLLERLNCASRIKVQVADKSLAASVFDTESKLLKELIALYE